MLDHKERQTQESTKYQEALIQNANPQREPSTPTICTSYTQGCRSTSRQRHLPAQESPSPQLKCPIPCWFTIRHFRIRSRKPGHRAVSKLDNRKHLGPWESCSFQPSAEGFKETSSYSHVLQLKFPPEWDVCIGFIGKKKKKTWRMENRNNSTALNPQISLNRYVGDMNLFLSSDKWSLNLHLPRDSKIFY